MIVRIEESVEIGRSPQEVWDFVVYPENDPQWCRKVKSVEALGGDRWTVLHKPVPFRPPVELAMDHIERDAPSSLKIREEDEASLFHVEYRLASASTGTRFTQVSEFDWKTLPRTLRRFGALCAVNRRSMGSSRPVAFRNRSSHDRLRRRSVKAIRPPSTEPTSPARIRTVAPTAPSTGSRLPAALPSAA